MSNRRRFTLALLASILSACGGGRETPDPMPPESPVTAAAFQGGGTVTYTVGAYQVTVVDLGLLPGGTTSSARAINNAGRVVGMANDASFAPQRVMWDLASGAIVSTLPNFDPSSTAEPAAINDANEVAGTERISSSLREGVYWDAFGSVYGLPPIVGGSSIQVTARAINRDGWIAGSSQSGGPEYLPYPVMWQRNAAPIALGLLASGSGAEALALNDLRHVVGVASAGALTRGFLWRGGKLADLGAIGGSSAVSRANAINNAGVIAGTSDGGTIAVRWRYNVNDAGSSPVIEALPLPSGLVLPSPQAINDAGDIVGTATLSTYNGTRAILWRNGEAINLGTWPGGASSRAFGINQAGQIVGDGDLNGDGRSHALLWTVSASSGGTATNPGPSPSPANTAPSVSLSATSSTSLKVGGTLQVSGSFSDPDAGPWRYVIDWGDGSTSAGSAAQPGSIAAAHVYATASPKRGFKVVLTVADASGASGASSALSVKVASR